MSEAAEPRATADRQGWPLALALVALCLACLAWAFAEEAAAAVRVWNASTAYTHCWLVLPIAGWLAWTRRHRLAALRPEPSWLAVLLVLPLSIGWLLAERLGIMEGRQLSALLLTETVVIAILGWRFARAMAAPLGYLVFLVPTGEFLTPWLQEVTTHFVDAGLNVIGIPHYIDGFIIQTPHATFMVAEACAGLRFLIAAIAFGALYALVMFRSPMRRLAVLLLSVVVPIVANGFRALGLVLLGHYAGDAQAALADHVTYGWVFFSVVMLLLILAGLPFREDGAEEPAPPRSSIPMERGASSWMRSACIGGAALLLGLTGPVAALELNEAAGRAADVTSLDLTPVPGCAREDGSGDLRCGEAVVTARMVAFSPRATWSGVAVEANRALALSDTAQRWRVPGQNGEVAWQVGVDPNGRASAVAIFLGGRPAGGLSDRLRQALGSIGMGSGRPVLLILEFEGAANTASAQVNGVLREQAGLVANATRRSRGG